ncbi:MAG: ribonuclease P protein component [Pseudomonadota bacterium]
MKKRRDFLAVRGGTRVSTRAFVVEGRRRREASTVEPGLSRIGYTVTKRIGNAVIRNRVKRRLRAATAAMAQSAFAQGFDYVVIARADAQHMPFAELCELLGKALARTRQPKEKGRRRTQPKSKRSSGAKTHHPQSSGPDRQRNGL